MYIFILKKPKCKKKTFKTRFKILTKNEFEFMFHNSDKLNKYCEVLNYNQ